MKKIKRIEQGDSIAVVATSAGVSTLFPHRVERGIEALKNIGLKPKVFPTVGMMNKNGAGDPEVRAKDINDAFEDSDIKAIIAVTGGYTANQIIEYLDFDLIKRNPKAFVGYSDNTMIHCALQKCNIVSFYGPCLITQFAEFPSPFEYTLSSFKRCLMSNDPMGEIRPSEYWTEEFLDWFEKKDLERPRALTRNINGHMYVREGEAEGVLLGGCLPVLLQTLGTPIQPEFEGGILILETPEGHTLGRGKTLAEVRANMWNLRYAGVFSKINGLVFGRGYGYSKEENAELLDIIKESTDGFSFPIIVNVNVGHSDPIATLPLGVKAKLSSKLKEFQILESACGF